ncbi:MAG: hypothetical protein ACLUGY_26620 [Phocaeicola massiliensis]
MLRYRADVTIVGTDERCRDHAIICASPSAVWQKRDTGSTCHQGAGTTGQKNTGRDTYAPTLKA